MRITLFNIALPSIALLFATAAIPIRAQLPMAEDPTAERGQRESDRDLEERIANMRYLTALAEKRGSRRKAPKLALEELQEDFTRLQIVNKELVLTNAKSKDIDLKFVVKRTAEISMPRDCNLIWRCPNPKRLDIIKGTGLYRTRSS